MTAPLSSSGLAVGLVLGLTGLLAPPSPGAAQEAHAYYVGGSTAPHAFDGATGFGAGVTLRVRDWLRLQGALDRRSHSVEQIGIACVSTVTDISCREDQLVMDSRFTALTVAAIPSWAPNELIEIGAGGGVLISQATTDVTAVSGLEPKVFADPSGSVGILGIAGLRFAPTPVSPVFVTAQFQGRRIQLASCPTGENFVAPFCGTEWWTELHLGLGVRF